ncbi:MAG: hypothetical protein Q7S79_01695 [bacterium]|nr:hypothetical protein [bacterium]
METPPAEVVKETAVPKEAEKPTFEQKAKALYKKHNLDEVHPRQEKVIGVAKALAEKYTVPEDFFDDELNLALTLGCGEKLESDLHPLHRQRIDSFFQRLVYPVVPEGVIDGPGLWGEGNAKGRPPIEGIMEYVEAHTDREEAERFLEENDEYIQRAKNVWRNKGRNLTVKAHVVSGGYRNFIEATQCMGFIRTPSKEEIDDQERDLTVTIVIPQGQESLDAKIVRHELYHIEDYGNYVRRGLQNAIFDGLDELHTEYKVGNFTATKDDSGKYWSHKQLWSHLVEVVGLDFNLLEDREKTAETIIRQFGTAGLVDFAMLASSDTGREVFFQTFNQEWQRAFQEMLLDREKLELRKAAKNGTINEAMINIGTDLERFKTYRTLGEGSFGYEYSIEEFLRYNQEYFSVRVVVTEPYDKRLPAKEAHRLAKQYFRVFAYSDLAWGREVDRDEQVLGLTKESPYKRTGDTLKADLTWKYENHGDKFNSEGEFASDYFKSLYCTVQYRIPNVEVVFSMANPVVRQDTLKPFFNLLDDALELCAEYDNYDATRIFIEGAYKYNLSWELREEAMNYIAAKGETLSYMVSLARENHTPKESINRGFFILEE